MTSENTIPAVVLGLHVNGLGVARWLDKENIPVYACDVDFSAPSGSTWTAKKIKIRNMEGMELIEDLIKLRNQFDQIPVLFITMERTVRTISKYRDKLKNLYRFTMPDHDVLMELMDKKGVLKYAKQSGIDFPQTLNVNQSSDIDGATNFTFPCIFKPATQNLVYGNKFKKAYKTNSLNEIKSIYEEVNSIQKDMVIQEWIEGTDSDIYFLLEYINKNGDVVADFPGRKVRSWPPNVGGTASCTSAYDLLDEMREACCKYFKAVNFVGAAGMEFKQDQRSKKLMMIEPTVARTDLQHEVAMLHGENLVYAQYCSEIGREYKCSTGNLPQKIWKYEPINRYSRSLVNNPAQDQLEKKYPSVECLTRIDDPLPFIYHLSGMFVEKFTNLFIKIKRRIRR